MTDGTLRVIATRVAKALAIPSEAVIVQRVDESVAIVIDADHMAEDNRPALAEVVSGLGDLMREAGACSIKVLVV